jgi:transposase InsO family protein
MPKIQWERLPREKWAHLRRRATERKISQDDLFALAEWKALVPDVPDGDWCKDFGSFKLCGTGRFPSKFLTREQIAHGAKL